MRNDVKVLIVSGSRLWGEVIQRSLEDGPDPMRCELLLTENQASLPRPAFRPDGVVIAPQSPADMRQCLAHLKAWFRGSRWLLLADSHLTEMFRAEMENQAGVVQCEVLDVDASLDDFRVAVRSLVGVPDGQPARLLLGLFASRAPALLGRESVPALTPRELSIGCAVSLGLTDLQIEEVIGLSGGPAAEEVDDLRRKLELEDRDALANLFTGALGPQ